MYVSLRNSPVAAVLSSRGVSRTVVTLGFVSLLTDISSEMVAAVLPLFVVVQLGLSPLTYGFVEGVYQAGSVFARLLGGYLADVRMPKTIAAIGYGVSAICKALLMVATALPVIMAIVALDRAGKGLRTAPRDAMIADATPEPILGRAFGFHRALDTFGALLGPIVAWLLLMMALNDFMLVFFVSFCFALLGIILLVFLKSEHAEAADKTAEVQVKQTVVTLAAVAQIFRASSIRWLLIITALLSLATIADGLLYLSLASQGAIQTIHFPLLFVATNFVYLLTAIPVGNLADRIGRPIVFALGYIFLLMAYLGVGMVGETAGLVICVVGLGLYYTATDGVLSALTAPLLPHHLRSTGLSIVQATQAIGRAVGAILFGIAWSYLGLATAMWLFVGLLVIAVITAWLLLGRVRASEVSAT